jgi:hypothetical protein
MGTLTGYKTAKFVNEMLKDREARTGVAMKPIPPQMIYNYISKGYIPSTDGLVDEADAAEWAEAYVAKRAAKATK